MSGVPGSSPRDGPPPSLEARDLKDQFEQQQTLIAQLKEMLRKNEQQLVNKEKEVEEYATKLSNIKSRTKLKRTPKAGEKQETETGQSQTPVLDTPKREDKENVKEKEEIKTTPSRPRQGNLVLLRKKLEEQRMMFEQRGKENENKKGIKEMVEQLKAQLDERDLTIQELQKGFEASPAKATIASAVQSEPVVQPTVQLGESMQQQEMYAQIVYKDNKIVELNSKVLELEAKVLDLQENLREKDEVIDARTKAISLMSEDLSKKGKATLDTLDETREEMRVMQKNFVELEIKINAEKEELVQQLEAKEQTLADLERRMKIEKEELLQQLETKQHRVLQLEESSKNLESVHLDRIAKNEELQDLVVRLQQDENKRADELSKQLDESHKQMIKLKAQHKNKIKNLSKQIDNLKKVSDAHEEIVRLQNRIAELEEEKGNLQLHLVDFDDLKVSESNWKKEISELEGKIKELNEDLDSRAHDTAYQDGVITELKLGMEKEKEKSAELEKEITQLKTSAAETSNLKVSLEMKIVELEEQLDILAREKNDLQEELNNLKQQKEKAVHAAVQLNEPVTEKGMKLEEPDAFSENNKDIQNMHLSLKQTQIELEVARQKLEMQEKIISDLDEKQKRVLVRDVQESSTQAEEDFGDQLEEMLQKASDKEALKDMEIKLQEANKIVAELTALQEQYAYTQECNVEKLKALEAELTASKATISELVEQQKHLDSLRDTDSQTIKQLDSKLKQMQRICEEQREVIMDLNAKLAAREEEAEMQKEVIAQLEQLGVSGEKEEEERSSKISEILKELNEMAGDLEEWKRRCSEVEDRLEILGTEKGELQSRFEEVRNENQDLAKNLRERDERITAMQTLVDETGRKLQAREENLARVRSELGKLEQQYKTKCSNLEQQLQAKDELIQKVELDLKIESEKTASEHLHLNYAQEQLQEYKDIASQFRNRVDELEVEHQRVLEEMVQNEAVYKQDVNALRYEIADKMEYIHKLEIGRGEIQQLEAQLKSFAMQLQIRDEELHALKQDYTAKCMELERKASELQEKETKMKELVEKNKKLVANLKVKALNLKGQEEKLQKYEEIVQAKEAKFNELLKENERLEKLFEHSSDENMTKISSLTEELQSQSERVAMLIGQLTEERSKTEQLGEELSRATEKIVSLEMELKESQTNVAESALLKESNSALANKVSQLEREIGIFQIDVRNRDSEVTLLQEEVKAKSEEEQRINALLEQKTQEVLQLKQMLEEALKNKNGEQQHLRELLEQKDQAILDLQHMLEAARARSEQESNLRSLLAEKEHVISKLQCNLEEVKVELTSKIKDKDTNDKVNLLEQELIRKNEEITDLQEKVANMIENQKQTVCAMEAKLQEKEAVVESLEQELAKTRQQVQHLEDGLANVEEGRRSLESKAEALGLRLEESNRVNEEVVETETMLERRLAELLEAESLHKKKLEVLQFGNEELTQKIDEMKVENSALKRELANVEGSLRTAQREVEELSPLEASLAVERERVEALEAEMKRAALEAEHRQREKVAEVKRYAESLETDLRNFNTQLEQAEADRRGLMERCEKLNDEKMNLDDEVENLNQAVDAYKVTVAGLEGKKNDLEKTLADKDLVAMNMEQKLKEREMAYKELQEQAASLQGETQMKSVEIEQLKKEYQEMTDRSNEVLGRVSNEREQLRKEFEENVRMIEEQLLTKHSSEKLAMKKDFEERIQHLEEQLEEQKDMLVASLMQENDAQTLKMEEAGQVAGKEMENQTVQLDADLENLKAVLKQRDAEIKSYQTRLLRLQFGNSSEKSLDVSQEQIFSLEDENSQLQEAIRVKDVYISELGASNSALNTELNTLIQQTREYQSKVTELTQELEAAQNKHTENKLNTNIAELISELEEKLSLLKNEKEDLYLNLITEKAKQEVALVIRLAENYTNSLGESTLQELLPRPCSVTFQDSKESSPDSIQTSEFALELEEQLKAVITELNLVKAERDEALLRISVLESAGSHPVEAISCLETNDTILMMERVPPQDIEVVPVEDQPALPHKELEEALGFSQKDVTKIPSDWDDGVEEEGWAWGSDEAKLEEEHIQKQQLVTQIMAAPGEGLRLRVEALEEHIKDLEVEKEKLSEELQTAQIRAGKMLKKLKDLKLKNESLMKENLQLAKLREQKQFTDLDQAIEEELKIRIDAMEKEVKEARAENETLYSEKESLAKRVDVLTSANEHFVEMKERQDMENEVWQQRNRELQNQIEALEWRISELMEDRAPRDSGSRVPVDDKKTPANAFFSWDKQVTEASSSNNELQEHLSALAADNENLQSLLEEQRNLRLAAEAGLQNLRHAQNETQVETSQAANRLAAENQALRESYEAALVELQHLQSAPETVRALQQENTMLQQESSRLSTEQAAVQERYNRLNTELTTLQEEHALLKQECSRLNAELAASQQDYHVLRTDQSGDVEAHIQTAAVMDLKRKIEELSAEKSKLELIYQKLVQEHSLLSEHLQGSHAEMQQLQQNNESRIIQCNKLVQEHRLLSEHLQGSHAEMQQLQQNNESLMIQCNELNKNLALANMQKLNLEHEVHSLRSQLEATAVNMIRSDKEDVENDKMMELDAELRVKSEEIETLRQRIETLNLEHAQAEREWSMKAERLRKDLDTSNEDLFRERNCHSILAKEHQELQAEFSAQLYEMERSFAEALSLKEKDLENMRIKLAERESSKTNEKTEDSVLHKLLEKEQEVSKLLDVRDRLKQQLFDMEERLSVKATDAENLRLQLVQVEKTLQEQVGQRDKDIRNLQQLLAERDAQAQELQLMVDEEAQQLSELRELLEDRESAIHKLKDQLQSRRENSAASLEIGKSSEEHKEDKELEQKQSELDLALYMLHQRDVRIDELTLELMQLLEERDTLQLRLSNALRLNEELRARARMSASASPIKMPISAPPTPIIINDQHIATLSSESAVVQAVVTDGHEDLETLASKISQLRSVGYQRDVTLKDEREQRHTGQMQLLQQRGSGVVVDATYTLSRDVQSPSTVLLNWLWGRSTPKVMHI